MAKLFLMHLKLISVFTYLLKTVLSDEIDCIEGEMWFQPCRYCKCLDNNGTYLCEPNALSYRLEKCVKDVVIFRNNFRCHCAENNATVCVPLIYQEELDGKTCSGDYYYYDSCTFCECDDRKKKLQCMPITNCQLSSGGICNDGEVVFEDNCYKCNCAYTKFKKCVRSEECLYRKKKPGNCYIIQNYYNSLIQFFCTSALKQECYNDYDCPGIKKCCRVVDCYLRCVDPYFD